MHHFCGWFSNSAQTGQYAYLSFPTTSQRRLNFGQEQNVPHDSGRANESFLNHLLQQSNTFIRKTKKSDYSDLLAKYSRQKCKWTDPDFPPNDHSFGKIKSEEVYWKRMSDLFPEYTLFGQTDEQPQDLVGTGIFIQAIRLFIEDPYRIRNIFSIQKINRHGIYMLRVLDQGVFKEIVVDDFVPCDPTGRLLSTQPTKRRNLWPIIMEKVWAKVCGNYSLIQQTFQFQIQRAFTCAPVAFLVGIGEQSSSLWAKLQRMSKAGYLISGQTKRQSFVDKQGLRSGRQYKVLKLFDKPHRLVKLRGFCGDSDWSGRACNKDFAFWNLIPLNLKQIIGFSQNRNIFFMFWDDVVTHFSSFTVCQVNDNASYFNQDIVFSKKRGQYLEFYTEGTIHSETSFTISQNNLIRFPFQKQNQGLARTTIIVARYQKAHSGYEYKYVASNSSRERADNSLNVGFLEQGTYIIFVKCDWTRQQPDIATVSVYSEGKCRLKKISLPKSERFLYKILLDHARKNQKKQVLRQQPLQWICSDFLLNSCGYGYLAIHLDETSNRKLGIQLNEKQYNQKRLVLKRPYKGQGKIKNIVQPGKELIVVYRLKALNFPSQLTLPTPKIYNLI